MDIEGLPSRVLNAGASRATAAQQPGSCEPAAVRFDALYATYRTLLSKIAVHKFGIPRGDAEDLVHDVFATYLANPSNVRDLHPYLVGAICNASRQYRRRERAAPFRDAEPHEVCAATADDALMNEVIGGLVIRATLSRLGSSCRETLQRFYLLGETAVSIAQSRDTSANYITRLLNYCRNRARAIYRQIDGES